MEFRRCFRSVAKAQEVFDKAQVTLVEEQTASVEAQRLRDYAANHPALQNEQPAPAPVPESEQPL